jgi:hypothetical protein
MIEEGRQIFNYKNNNNNYTHTYHRNNDHTSNPRLNSVNVRDQHFKIKNIQHQNVFSFNKEKQFTYLRTEGGEESFLELSKNLKKKKPNTDYGNDFTDLIGTFRNCRAHSF